MFNPTRMGDWTARWLPRGIRGRLFLLIALVLVPLLALIGEIYAERYTTRRAQELEQQLEVARGVAATFDGFIKDLLHNNYIAGQAILTSMRNAPEAISALLTAAVSEEDAIRNVSWVDPTGAVLASSEPALVGQSLAGRAYLTRIREGQAWALGDLMERGTAFDRPTFAVASAVRNRTGSLQGIVVTGVEPARLGNRGALAQRGEGSAFAIFDSKGVLVYRHPELPLSWQQRQWRASDPLLDAALRQGREQTGVVQLEFPGTTRDWMSARVPIPELGWVAGAGRSQSAALAEVRESLVEDTLLAGLIGLLAFACAWYVGSTIATPLRRIEAEAGAVPGTALLPGAPRHAPVEVIHLRESLARMAHALIQRAERLRESERQFRQLADAMPQLVWTAGPDGRVDYYNVRCNEYQGIQRNADGEYQWAPVLHEEDTPATMHAWQQAVNESRPYQAEHRVRMRDGSFRWHLSRGVPAMDAEGRVTRWFGTATDIHDLKLAEAELRRERSRMRAILDNAPVLITVKDVESRMVLANRATLATVDEARRARFVGAHLLDLYPPEVAERARRSDLEVLQRGEPMESETVLPHADGSTHVYLTIKFPIRDIDDARRVLGVGAIATDITAIKRAEAALRTSEERFRTLADNIAQFAWIADAQGNIEWYNQRWYDYTGTVPGQDPEAVQRQVLHPDHSARVLERLRGAFARGEAWEDTFPLRGRDGEYRWFLSRAVPIRDAAGKVRCWFGTNTDITDRLQMEEEIRHMAQHDALTGLPNRRLYLDILQVELAEARRHHHRLAVLFMDLDRFKQINDTLGHETGDALLKEVAARLRECVRRSDTVARIGGDEFNILLPKITRGVDAADVARKMVDAMRRPFLLDGHELHVTTSIGISLFPDDGEEADALLRFADMAMYSAKEQGRNAFRFYDRQVNHRSLQRMQMERRLRVALEQGEMEIHYQPQVEVGSRRLICVEALMRWRHPERGLLGAGDFLGLADEIGLSPELDEWALETACRQARGWSRADRPLCLTVNVSARRFHDPHLARKVSATLERTGFAPRCLDLEISERTVMESVDQTAARLRELVALGVGVSIDHFGTGYSSLNHLRRLPIQKLKIDKSFVRDIATDADDRAIVSAVTAMAHNMGIRVLAEGVETEEQLSFLRANHCDEAQGFLFGAPLPEPQMSSFLSGRPAP